MTTLHVLYDDQSVVVRHSEDNGMPIDLLYIDKHTEMEDAADMIYTLLELFAPSADVYLEENE